MLGTKCSWCSYRHYTTCCLHYHSLQLTQSEEVFDIEWGRMLFYVDEFCFHGPILQLQFLEKSLMELSRIRGIQHLHNCWDAKEEKNHHFKDTISVGHQKIYVCSSFGVSTLPIMLVRENFQCFWLYKTVEVLTVLLKKTTYERTNIGIKS